MLKFKFSSNYDSNNSLITLFSQTFEIPINKIGYSRNYGSSNLQPTDEYSFEYHKEVEQLKKDFNSFVEEVNKKEFVNLSDIAFALSGENTDTGKSFIIRSLPKAGESEYIEI